ncbi:MAG: peptidoglycan DD-metalloendopeptidase family protein [Acidimicrobiales bacterium]|nr:peptidoglycan DD-metalloendopeptidase family protein [Acidimicrobiales bacterium]
MPRLPASRFRRILAAVCLAGVSALVVPAAAQESIQDAREQRSEAREQQLFASINIGLLEAEDIEVKEALDAAVELVNLQQARVDAARQALGSAEAELSQREQDLVWAEDDIRFLRAQVQAFSVDSYVSLASQEAEVWLSSEDATEATTKMAMVSSVTSGSVDLLDQLRAAVADRESALESAEEVQDRISELEAGLSAELVDLEASRERQAAISAELDVRIAGLEAELAEYEREEQAMTAFIQAEQARLEAERRVPTAPVGTVSRTGFIWPTSGSVGSGFGPRLHPILGYYRQHSGLDIGGAMGAPIWAAKDGVVISAGWQGGYGNAVVIQHDGNVATLYGHMSSIAVRVGQTVTAGEQIGAVGSTGMSTGPHLHFETRVNGVPQDPRGFLP